MILTNILLPNSLIAVVQVTTSASQRSLDFQSITPNIAKMNKLFVIFTVITTISIFNAIAPTAQATNSYPPVAIEATPNPTSIARRTSKPKIKVQSSKVSSMVRTFKPIRFQAGKKALVLGSNDLKSILKKHHPKAYGRHSGLTETETFFPRKTKTRYIVKAIRSVFKQNRHQISQGKTLVTGIYKNKKYELGYDHRDRIRHFVPKK
jgi:hypothetical protein